MVTAQDAAANGVVWEETPCPLCGASDARELLAVPGEAAGDVYRVAQCRCCDMVYLNPRPNRASIGRFYADNYHPYQAPRRERSAFARRLQRLICTGRSAIRRRGRAGRTRSWPPSPLPGCTPAATR